MQILRHLCGQPLERGAGPRGAYYQLIRIGDHGGRAIAVDHCPTCNEPLSDTDMLDGAGVLLIINLSSEWSIARWTALAWLATAGYALRWEDGQWRIQDGDTAIASADTLDVIIALAHALLVPDRQHDAGGTHCQ